MPEQLLQAYAVGVFPMAESRDDPRMFFVDPKYRGVIPLEDFHIPRRLRKTIRKRPFEIRCDTDFVGTLDACAEETSVRPETWINPEIRALYLALYERGHAHSIECWRGDELVGGLYGVVLGGAFFGESMFSRATDASKIALCHLAARLYAGGFKLLDSQFITDHLKQFGAIEIPRAMYRDLLDRAIATPVTFYREGDDWSLVEDFLQSRAQTS